MADDDKEWKELSEIKEDKPHNNSNSKFKEKVKTYAGKAYEGAKKVGGQVGRGLKKGIVKAGDTAVTYIKKELNKPPQKRTSNGSNNSSRGRQSSNSQPVMFGNPFGNAKSGPVMNNPFGKSSGGSGMVRNPFGSNSKKKGNRNSMMMGNPFGKSSGRIMKNPFQNNKNNKRRKNAWMM